MASLFQATHKAAGGICLSNKLLPWRAVRPHLAPLAFNGLLFLESSGHIYQASPSVWPYPKRHGQIN